MDISEIIKDSFTYPFTDKRQFGLIFLIFILLGLIVGGSFVSLIYLTGIGEADNGSAFFAVALIITLIVFILLGGYQLSIISVACRRDDAMPAFNPVKNFKDGLKVILLYLAFYIINGLISFSLSFVSVALLSTGEMIATLIAVILYLVLFVVGIFIGWILSMSLCRLAYYGSMDEAFQFKQAYDDLKTIGIGNMLVYVIVMGIIFGSIFMLTIMVALLVIQSSSYISIFAAASLVLFAVWSYISVVQPRAMGLLYSNVEYDF